MKKGYLKDKVKAWCAYTNEACNDDNYLIAAIWLEQGWDSKKSLYDNLQHVSSAQSIVRERRKLHQDGIINYSTEVENRRFRAFTDKRDEYSFKHTDLHDDRIDNFFNRLFNRR